VKKNEGKKKVFPVFGLRWYDVGVKKRSLMLGGEGQLGGKNNFLSLIPLTTP
jgi:hypothetical protein